jgi:hypothetical protein
MSRYNTEERKVANSISDEITPFSIRLILPVALWFGGSIQPLIEMSTRNFPGGGGIAGPACKDNNLTAINEQNI